MKKHKTKVGLTFTAIILTLIVVVLFNSSEGTVNAKRFQTARWGETPQIFGARRGNPWINVQDGKENLTDFAGTAELRARFENNETRPLSIATADFDEDGMPDIVIGYENGAATLMRGNVDAVYPNTPEANERKERGEFTDTSFSSPAKVFKISIKPDFLAAGDFDADGHFDIVAAQRGSRSISYFRGDGSGGFLFAKEVVLSGRVTALLAEDFNRRDGLNDVIIGVEKNNNGAVIVFEHQFGAMKANPEMFEFDSPVMSLGTGYLEGDMRLDLAVATGSELAIINGRDRRLFSDENGGQSESVQITRQNVGFEIKALAVGEFIKSEDYRHEVALIDAIGSLQIIENRGRKNDSILEAEWEKSHEVMISRQPTAVAPLLVTSRISARAVDTLIVADGDGLRLLTSDFLAPKINETPKLNSQSFGVEAVLDTNDIPKAILPMRLNVDALSDLVIVNEKSVLPTVVQTVPAVTFTVNSSADDADNNVGDGICLTAANTCTYRAAREEISWDGGTMGLTTINFNIPGGGIPTIIVPGGIGASNPGPYIVDGTTQPISNLVEFTGVAPVEAAHNTVPFQDGHVFRGMVINGYNDFNSYFLLDRSNNCIVEGNRIGTNVAGTAVQSSADVNQGVAIVGGANNSRVGGTVAAARNIISTGTGYGVYVLEFHVQSVVQGNYIGADVTGTVALGNRTNGIYTQGNVLIGGTAAGAGNIIAGTTDDTNIPGLWANGITARLGAEPLTDLLI